MPQRDYVKHIYAAKHTTCVWHANIKTVFYSLVYFSFIDCFTPSRTILWTHVGRYRHSLLLSNFIQSTILDVHLYLFTQKKKNIEDITMLDLLAPVIEVCKEEFYCLMLKGKKKRPNVQ